ncbi:MAG: MoxR family ATPase [Lachnospiraceae bacterium]|nr:MoxR family ATPase [Lachnospiraceae bacterium]
MNLTEAKAKLDALKNNIEKVIIGNEDTIDKIITALIAGGHVLLEDTPGTGKTTLARVCAGSINGKFSRIQFTPDLLPADITGLNVYNRKEDAFVFVEGPIMANILLADEINRATPRTQSALLEAMQEQQVTVDGVSRSIGNPFMVIATQNPIETAGTFPLPEAQLDRFTMQLSMGFPEPAEEAAMLNRFSSSDPTEEIAAVLSTDDIATIKELAKTVRIHQELVKYIVDIVQSSRKDPAILTGASPRAALCLQTVSKARALTMGRDYVLPEDIRDLAPDVLTHRMLFYSATDRSGKLEVVNNLLSRIPVPSEDFS